LGKEAHDVRKESQNTKAEEVDWYSQKGCRHIERPGRRKKEQDKCKKHATKAFEV